MKTKSSARARVKLSSGRVPFLLLAPVKKEFRVLPLLARHADPAISRLGAGVRLFTAGNERVSPLRINLLAYPAGVTIDEHIGALLVCFRAATPLYGPLEALLADALRETYARVAEGRKFPRLSDLVDTARRIATRRGYSGEVESNLRAALDLRLGQLTQGVFGAILDCEDSVPALEELFTSNVVIEMDSLPIEQARLLSLFILTALRHYIRVTRRAGCELAHVTVIEEAHAILGRTSDAQASEIAADPGAFAADFVTRMLAEVRALGEAVVIADQLPSAVAPEVIKSTATKIAFSLLAADDRERLGGTMLMGRGEIEELPRLHPGEAFFFTQGYFRPRRVQTVPVFRWLGIGPGGTKGAVTGLPEALSDTELAELLEGADWYRCAREARLQQDLDEMTHLAQTLTGIIGEGRSVLARGRAVAVTLRGDVAEPDDTESVVQAMKVARSRTVEVLQLLQNRAALAVKLARLAQVQGATARLGLELRARLASELGPDAGCLAENLVLAARRVDALRRRRSADKQRQGGQQ